MGYFMVINIRQIKYCLVFLYPLFNIFVCYVFDGDNMTTFSLAYCILLALTALGSDRMNRYFVFIILLLVATLGICLYRENSSEVSLCLDFVATVVMFIVLSERYYKIDNTRKFLIDHLRLFYLMEIGFAAILTLYVTQKGLRAGWNTYVLQGPYNYPHTLAYFLELMLMVNVFIWLQNRSRIAFAFALICEAAIFLTAVRTVLLSSFLVLFYILCQLIKKRNIRRLLIVMLVLSIAICVGGYVGLFDALIAKTRLALHNVSITNGRGRIAAASLKALSDKGHLLFNILFGVGTTGLLRINNTLLGYSIHAHNDFVDILVSYGILNLGIYIIAFCKFAKENIIWISLCIALLAFSNGLYMYIDCIPVLIYARLLFSTNRRISPNDLEKILK